jgi:hypothetical protein
VLRGENDGEASLAESTKLQLRLDPVAGCQKQYRARGAGRPSEKGLLQYVSKT